MITNIKRPFSVEDKLSLTKGGWGGAEWHLNSEPWFIPQNLVSVIGMVGNTCDPSIGEDGTGWCLASYFRIGVLKRCRWTFWDYQQRLTSATHMQWHTHTNMHMYMPVYKHTHKSIIDSYLFAGIHFSTIKYCNLGSPYN